MIINSLNKENKNFKNKQSELKGTAIISHSQISRKTRNKYNNINKISNDNGEIESFNNTNKINNNYILIYLIISFLVIFIVCIFLLLHNKRKKSILK